MKLRFVTSSKSLIALCSLLVSLIHFDARAALPTAIDSAVNPANNHTYYLLSNSTWTDAESAAISLGGHLATINDLAENSWVWNRWGTGHSLWIGLNDAAVEGTFVWANGEPVSFTHWNSGEPNNGAGFSDEDYTYILANGQAADGVWNDYQNLATVDPQPQLFGVVEVVPEPSTAVFLVSGMLIGLIGKKKIQRSTR